MKKTEIKRIEKEKKKLEKQMQKRENAIENNRIWEDCEDNGKRPEGAPDPWWYSRRKVCLNEIIGEYKYPM